MRIHSHHTHFCQKKKNKKKKKKLTLKCEELLKSWLMTKKSFSFMFVNICLLP